MSQLALARRFLWIQTKLMQEIRLEGEEERMRAQCEREASRQWPGARVLLDRVQDQIRAAVYLPEDGIELDASSERSGPHSSAREALTELLAALRRKEPPLGTD